MKKRLIALMCAGIMVTTLTGCSTMRKTEQVAGSRFFVDNLKKYDDVYITLTDNGTKILHKGDVNYVYDYMGTDGLGFPNLTKMNFDCGETLLSNYQYSLSNKKPSEENYDKVCEGCLGIEE